MLLRPICEPVELPLGIVARVERVVVPAGAPSVGRLLHFHDVAEIVLFGAAHGRFVCDGESFAIQPGAAVFAPGMMYHDFDLDGGEMDWTLIQLDTYAVEQFGQGGVVPARPFLVVPDAAAQARIAVLATWLDDLARSDPADPMIERIVGLLLAQLARLPGTTSKRHGGDTSLLARFMPAIQRLRDAPGAALLLRDAAALCHLSPAYFSRRFTTVFGCGFADYTTAYRLHLAARHVATTAAPLSEIGYRFGFSSHSHFTARFRERFGMTPRDYRGGVALA